MRLFALLAGIASIFGLIIGAVALFFTQNSNSNKVMQTGVSLEAKGEGAKAIVAGRDVLINEDNSRTIIIQTSGSGKLTGISFGTTAAGEAAQSTLQNDLLPQSKNEEIGTREDVQQLASKYGLLTRPEANPGLRFKDGDLAYWSQQRLSIWELELEFYSRALVLKAADQRDAIIPTQGDLSHFSQQIYATLYQASKAIWASKK